MKTLKELDAELERLNALLDERIDGLKLKPSKTLLLANQYREMVGRLVDKWGEMREHILHNGDAQLENYQVNHVLDVLDVFFDETELGIGEG